MRSPGDGGWMGGVLSVLTDEAHLQLELCHDAALDAGVQSPPQHQLVGVELAPLLCLCKHIGHLLLRVSQGLQTGIAQYDGYSVGACTVQ